MIHLDTHVVVWLYIGDHARIPPPLRDRLNDDSVSISPMVRLELSMLHEIGRLTDTSTSIVDEMARALDLRVDETPFPVVVAAADNLRFTRDPFDRIIVAQAVAAGADLATKDRRIRENLASAIWD